MKKALFAITSYVIMSIAAVTMGGVSIELFPVLIFCSVAWFALYELTITCLHEHTVIFINKKYGLNFKKFSDIKKYTDPIFAVKQARLHPNASSDELKKIISAGGQSNV